MEFLLGTHPEVVYLLSDLTMIIKEVVAWAYVWVPTLTTN